MWTKANILERTFGNEGGYVKIASDRGKATRFGVTEKLAATYEAIWEEYQWDGDMRMLPKALAFKIIDEEFWQTLQLDGIHELSPMIANKLLDWGYNAGPHRPAMALQEHLNASNVRGTHWDDLVADGIPGSDTRRALAAYLKKRGQKAVMWTIVALSAAQGTHYLELAQSDETQEDFYNGWVARIFNELQEYHEYTTPG